MWITQVTLLYTVSLVPIASAHADPFALVSIERQQSVVGYQASTIPGPLLDSSASFADYDRTVGTTLFADAPPGFPIEPDDRDLALIDYSLSQASTVTSEADAFTVDFLGSVSLLPKSSPPRNLPFVGDYSAFAETRLSIVFDLDVAAVLEFEGSLFGGTSLFGSSIEGDVVFIDAVIEGIVPSGTQIFPLEGPPPTGPVFLDLDPGLYTLNLGVGHEITVEDYEQQVLGDVDLGFEVSVTITVPAPGGLLLACTAAAFTRRRR